MDLNLRMWTPTIPLQEMKNHWPFLVTPHPEVPVVLDTLYFRNWELVHILGRLVQFEIDGAM